MSWLDQPKLWILDIGAGTGAATFAILDLMCDYQNYRWDHRYPVIDKEIYIIAVDPCKFAGDIYSKQLEDFLPALTRQHIHVNPHRIIDEFPQESCLERITSEWAKYNTTNLLTIASNVVRPLQNNLDKLKALFVIGGTPLNLELGDLLAKAYEYLLQSIPFRSIIQIDIVTKMKSQKGEWLYDILKKIAKSSVKSLRKDPHLYGGAIKKNNQSIL